MEGVVRELRTLVEQGMVKRLDSHKTKQVGGHTNER